MSDTSGAPSRAAGLWLMWLAMALFGTIGVFSVFDGFAEDDVQAGWAGVLVLSVVVLSVLYQREGFRRVLIRHLNP